MADVKLGVTITKGPRCAAQVELERERGHQQEGEGRRHGETRHRLELLAIEEVVERGHDEGAGHEPVMYGYMTIIRLHVTWMSLGKEKPVISGIT